MKTSRRIICIMLVLTFCLACHAQASTSEKSPTILIAYFSLANNAGDIDSVDASSCASIVVNENGKLGTTAYIASVIQKALGGDMYAIQTAAPYPSDFDEVVNQNHQEAANSLLPQLSGSVTNMARYDTVFIGYPVWASGVPQAIRAFIAAHDLSGKTVIPFCTHDGYGSGSSFGDIAQLCLQSTILDGYAVSAKDAMAADPQVLSWLDTLGVTAPSANHGETKITVQFGDAVLDGVLYDTPEAKQFIDMLPITVSMWQFGGREFYGGIDGAILPQSEGQLFFANGDITYCAQNDTVAIFYAQTDRPNLTMQVIPMGRVTSDLNTLIAMDEDTQMTFALAK